MMYFVLASFNSAAACLLVLGVSIPCVRVLIDSHWHFLLLCPSYDPQ